MTSIVKTNITPDLLEHKKKCLAYVKFNTIGKAYEAVNDGLPIYLVKESHNAKPFAFCRCSKTTDHIDGLCHIHKKSSQIKKFENDILPQNENDSLRWKANIKDPYFENMGKRGAKKKNIQNSYNFPQKDDSIKEILEHKDKKLKVALYIYANKLLKNNFKIPDEKDNLKKPEKLVNNELNKSLDTIFSKKSSDELSNSKNDSSGRLTDMNKLKENNKIVTKKSSDELLSDNESDNNSENESDNESDNKPDNSNNESINESGNNKKISDFKNMLSEDAEDSEDDEDSDGEEEVHCEEIYTINKNKLLWYNKENNTVYSPEEDDGGEEIGILKEINKKYHTIIFESKYFTVIEFVKHKKYKNINCCVITNKLFNDNYEHIGNRKIIENNKYEMFFFNEI